MEKMEKNWDPILSTYESVDDGIRSCAIPQNLTEKWFLAVMGYARYLNV